MLKKYIFFNMKIKYLFKGKKKLYIKIPNEEKSLILKRADSKDKRKIIYYFFLLFIYTLLIICAISFIIIKGNSSRAAKN